MNPETYSIQIDVRSTLVGSLYARAKYSQLYPEILEDSKAVKLIEEVKKKHPESQLEFSKMEEFIDEFYGLSFINRARVFDDAIRDFLEFHPHATVVNLGCGLDTTFTRVDNGKLRWFDLDLPDVIEYRKTLLQKTERNRFIPKSIFDFTWFDDVKPIKEGIFFIAGGLFQYFSEEQISDLIIRMSKEFSKGELLFDNPSSFGNKVINKRFSKKGVTGIGFDFSVNNPEKLVRKWSNNIILVNSFPVFSKIPRKRSWKTKTKVMISLSTKLKLVKFVHLRFNPL